MIAALQRINSAVRVIAASGLNGNFARATKAHVNHFLAKPYSSEAILQMLRSLLDTPSEASATSSK